MAISRCEKRSAPEEWGRAARPAASGCKTLASRPGARTRPVAVPFSLATGPKSIGKGHALLGAEKINFLNVAILTTTTMAACRLNHIDSRP